MSPVGRVYFGDFGRAAGGLASLAVWSGARVCEGVGDVGVSFGATVAGRGCRLVLLSAGVVVFGSGLWWPETIPPCLASFVGHPFGACDAVSSAGRFWPARLLSSRLGGGELSGGGGVGRGVGRSRGLVGRVPEEHPSAAGLDWAAHK